MLIWGTVFVDKMVFCMLLLFVFLLADESQTVHTRATQPRAAALGCQEKGSHHWPAGSSRPSL